MKRFSMVLVLAFVAFTWATPVTFFGEDKGLGEGTPLSSWANADAAKADFFSNLSGVNIFDFEASAVGSSSPLAANFGSAGTATIVGNGSVASVPTGSTNGVGRYAISGTKYWEATDAFTINFSEAISAFGFYGIDIGDFSGQITLTMVGGATTNLTVPNSTNLLGGSVDYFGFYDLAQSYTSISFGNTAAGTDYFGFDDFTIGTKANVVPTSVPEPLTTSLLGLGLLGIAFFRRKRNK